MEKAEYELMNAVEDRMWWYQGAHANALALCALHRRKTAAPGSGPALDAGCGTGGLLAKLARAHGIPPAIGLDYAPRAAELARAKRSEEPTSELQSLMRNSYAVFCLKKKKKEDKK